MHKKSLSKFSKVVYFAQILAPGPWARGSELWGCPRMEDTLSIDVFGKFDFPVPKFGVHDAGAPERIIRRIAEEYFLFVGMDITDMELIHIYSPSIIS